MENSVTTVFPMKRIFSDIKYNFMNTRLTCTHLDCILIPEKKQRPNNCSFNVIPELPSLSIIWIHPTKYYTRRIYLHKLSGHLIGSSCSHPTRTPGAHLHGAPAKLLAKNCLEMTQLIAYRD